MNAKELVRRWKDRQTQILAMLPEAVRTEFHELTVAIRRAESEFKENKRAAAVASPGPESKDDFGEILEKLSQRVPLESRKKQVVEFLAEHGPSKRGDILHALAIPNGTLSNVLLDENLFERNAENCWQLVEQKPNANGAIAEGKK